ncbi:MAG: IS1380 family transposase [candidate division KSB1 bacterium]|nr:IS1380 family transposase [candidate division KSB1 bacterium]
MNNQSHKKSQFQSKEVKHSFTGNQLTPSAVLSPIMKYINKLKLGLSLNHLFPTLMHNATKFTTVQILLSVVLASFAGINRLKRFAAFTHDALVKVLLDLETGLNKDVISTRLKALGQAGAILLQEHLFKLTTRWLTKSQLESITLDADSTVKTVYGNQQGAEKGYNHKKPGANSYHPMLAFVSQLKLVVNSWFRCGSAYTSNGICEFINQTQALLPSNIKQVFFRADSRFFNGALFDLLESFHWTYLIKVKLKNLQSLLASQNWYPLPGHPDLAICEFQYQGKSWTKKRTLKAIRIITEWVPADFMGIRQWIPKYEYACHCSNLTVDVLELHELYKHRSTSETWIEQVKNQLLAGGTLTDDFHANDILWQLNVLAYNLSVMMRYKVKQLWRQEHATFRDWFINLPAKLVHGGRQISLKIYQNYYYKNRWIELDRMLQLS